MKAMGLTEDRRRLQEDGNGAGDPTSFATLSKNHVWRQPAGNIPNKMVQNGKRFSPEQVPNIDIC